MYQKTLKNLVSDAKPVEPFEQLEAKRLSRPDPNSECTLCGRCARACSGRAIVISEGRWSVDLGRCVFCRDCYDICEHISSVPAPHYALRREDLVFLAGESRDVEGQLPREKTKAVRGSVAIRELDTGSCNACESEANARGNKYYDMERFGIKVTPSPRHADALLVTGPMTRNMLVAAQKTYDAVPNPKLVVACGTCAISGGLFVTGDVVGEGISDTLPADIFVVGCPPTPNGMIVSLIKALGLRH
ncbi:MAG: hydrogenase [archaeon]|nr:hydrogenase [archaeon]